MFLIISEIYLFLFRTHVTYVAFEFSFDKMHSKSERIYRVQSTFHEGEVLTDDWATSSFGYGSAMQENLAGIEDYTRVG